jgi:hypothetical protein
MTIAKAPRPDAKETGTSIPPSVSADCRAFSGS